MPFKKSKLLRRIVIFLSAFLVIVVAAALIFINFYLEPLLKNRIHLLIIQGSDSLYTYKLGDLKANFLGGNVEVENLQIDIDSIHYRKLSERNALPALTYQVKLQKGNIKGIGILALLLQRKIDINSIMSSDADIRLSRHPRKKEVVHEKIAIWRAIRPKIQDISIHTIRFDGIRLHYTNADTTEALKLQFDRCDALFKDIRIDSLASLDTSRIAFTKSINIRFNGLKFRTRDSTYKMKAKTIVYSSADRSLEIDSFKLQPTLDKEAYYQKTGEAKSLYYIVFDKVRFVQVHLDQFIHSNIIEADSILMDQPKISIYLDRNQTPIFMNRNGKYPHEELLRAPTTVLIKNISLKHAGISYTESNPKTRTEGTIPLNDINISIDNITNDSGQIARNPVCSAKAIGTILNTSTINSTFKFFLDSSDGQFDLTGSVNNITAAQIDPIALALADTKVRSLNLHELNFHIRGEDFIATTDVGMRYSNLFIILHKTDEETGATTTKTFLTKLLNRYVLWPDNPGSDGKERRAEQIKVARLNTQTFFGFIWKSIFEGMQHVMIKGV